MNRTDMLAALTARDQPFEVLVIGGGATGAGIALDAASRGFSTALIERDDFASGTSSKSTKLIHGGVRYLAKAEFSLVREALRERALLLNNAPHLVEPQSFVIPYRGFFERMKYALGLRLYDWLAGDSGLPQSGHLSKDDVRRAFPALPMDGIAGGVRYWDAKFDDARLLWTIVEHAIDCGAVAANHCTAVAFAKHAGRLTGVVVKDNETNLEHTVAAEVVINASGVYSDEVCGLDEPGHAGGIAPSQGSHLVIDREFHRSDEALLIPRTGDGRVMFVVPWAGKAIVGTTDIAVEVGGEPRPLAAEIDQILDTVSAYLRSPPGRSDIRSCFAGIRPLSTSRPGMATSNISREHRIDESRSGLISITGGKWTTYRKMAQDCVDIAAAHLGRRDTPCGTDAIRFVEAHTPQSPRFSHYGRRATELERLVRDDAELGALLAPDLPYCKAEALWAVREEMARTIADVLARRTRALFLNAEAAIAAAPVVATMLASELGHDAAWRDSELARFNDYAQCYVPP